MENQEFIKNRNPVDYLKILFWRKWLFITPVFIGLIFTIFLSFILPPTYESSTVILVEEEKIINPIISSLAVSTTAAERMRNIREIILGWSSLVELTKKLNLAKDVQTQGQFEGLILSLRKNIYVQMRQPNIIKIGYFGKDPRQTQLIAKALTDILIEKNMESQTKETDVAINFIKEQLDIYKRKVKESEVAELEDELKKLLADSTEQHPMVKELRKKIDAAKKELQTGEYEVAAEAQPLDDPRRKALQVELDKLIDNETNAVSGSGAGAIAAEPETDTNNAIYKLLLMDKVGTSLAQDIDVNKNIYNMLLQKLETAKITQRLEASKEGTRYTIIDPPRLPLKPSKPNKLMVVFLGLFLGSFAGAGLVFGGEFLNHSFLDIEDAKNNLEFPVLGAISRITTQEEINREKSRKNTLLIIGAILSVSLIIIGMLISLFAKR